MTRAHSSTPLTTPTEARVDGAEEAGPAPTHLSGDEPLVSLVLDRWADDGGLQMPDTPGNGRGAMGLCPPPATGARSTRFSTSEDSFEPKVTDGGPEVEGGLPPALQRLDLVGTEQDPYQDGGPWSYAKEHGGTCFFITTNARHESGRDLLTQGRIESTLAKKGYKKWTWILHDKDVYTLEEAQKIEGAVQGQPKADGYHVALVRKSFASIAQVAQAFGVPPETVEPKPPSAFLDLVEYQTHEHSNQQAKGKHLYADDEVHANFDWRAELEEHKLARSFKAGQRASIKKRDAIREAVMLGEMTLKQVREEERAIYIKDLDKLQQLQQDFRLHQPAPRHRTNYFIGGVEGDDRKGRTGKTQLAKLFARILFPDLDADECYYVASDPRVPLQNYKGQPVIIWDDYNALDLMEALGGRSGVWQVFDDHPSASDVNIKYGATRLVHTVNIITKTTPYAQFLDGLAGEYTDKAGKQHKAEDRNQSWGRFPVVFEVTIDSIEMLLNRGFASDTDDFLAYQKVARMKASMREISASLDAIEDEGEREAATYKIGDALLRPVLDQHARLQPVATRKGDEVVDELLGRIEVIEGEVLAAEGVAIAEEVAARDRELVEEQQRKRVAELEERNRELQLCTCPAPQAGVHARHDDECPALSEDERQRRTAARRERLERKADRVRNNGLVLGRP